MCGRYALYDIDVLPQRFETEERQFAKLRGDINPRYNIGPGQLVPAVRFDKDTGQRRIDLMKWGFIPRWADDPKAVYKYKTFNARAEDIFSKPTWKSAIRHNRCLVPANGFYEWKTVDDGKQPFYIHPSDQDLFAFAGIYNTWTDKDGNDWETYSIITTTPNTEMEPIHNRMPVILHTEDWSRWLDPSNDDPQDIADLLAPYDNGVLELFEVSREVNTIRSDNDTLVLPLNSR